MNVGVHCGERLADDMEAAAAKAAQLFISKTPLHTQKADLHRQKLRLLILRLLQYDVHPLPCVLVCLQLLQDGLRCRALHTPRM
jgi:hypothetical protein